MKKATSDRTEGVSLFRLAKAFRSIRLPWGFLCLYAVSMVLTMFGSLLMAEATGNMVDAAGNIATQTMVRFAMSYLVIGVGATVGTIFSGIAGERINVSLRENLWRKMMVIPLDHYDADSGETLVSRITTDCDNASELLVTLFSIASSALSLASYIAAMQAQSVSLTIGIVLIAPLSVLMGIVFGKAKFHLGQKTQSALAESTAYLIERTNDLPLIKVSGMSQAEAVRGCEVFDQQCAMEIRGGYLKVAHSFIDTALNIAGALVTFLLGVGLVTDGALTVGEVIAFYSISGSVTLAFSNLVADCGAVRQAVGAMSRVVTVLETESEVTDRGQDMDIPNEDIRLENITFGYGTEPVLENASCVIPKNKVTAIVGVNGSGKTTVFKLLERMYNPEQGLILFGKLPAKGFSLDAWRSAFGIVAQDRPVMEGTLRENITYGCKRDIPEEELWQVAKMARLDALVKVLPDGFDSYVAPGGRNFSGGQCQCIAIARAIMRNPDYLLLDEATSSLDGASEKEVMEALRNLMKGRTTIMITHDPALIRQADCIIEIKDKCFVKADTNTDIP